MLQKLVLPKNKSVVSAAIGKAFVAAVFRNDRSDEGMIELKDKTLDVIIKEDPCILQLENSNARV